LRGAAILAPGPAIARADEAQLHMIQFAA
jgi:hypothetical protein